MEVTQLLNKLLEFGINRGYFFVFEMGKLDKGCCKSLTIEVIDFDKTEEIHRTKHNYQILKSCDALKILANEGRIDFIEMKGFKQFMAWQLKADEPISIQVKEKVMNWEFYVKINDSITVLNNIIQSRPFNISGTERKLFHEIPKNYIILTDIEVENNGLESFLETMEFLAVTSSNIEVAVSKALSQEFQALEIQNFYNLQKPMLMSCKSFERFYQKEI